MREEIGNAMAVVGNYIESEMVVLEVVRATAEAAVRNIEHPVGEAVEVVCTEEGVVLAMCRLGEAENGEVAAAAPMEEVVGMGIVDSTPEVVKMVAMGK